MDGSTQVSNIVDLLACAGIVQMFDGAPLVAYLVFLSQCFYFWGKCRVTYGRDYLAI